MHPRWRPTVVTMLAVGKVLIGATLIIAAYVLAITMWPEITGWFAAGTGGIP